jgi:hypothetical protein
MTSQACQLFALHVVDAPLSLSVSLNPLRPSALFSHSLSPTESVNPLKHGNYGIGQASPKGVTFAPNVTPVTFVEPEDSLDSDPSSPTSSLFPPASTPAPPSRKRCPPGKRRSQGYIPRPPNAFMLFRADFVRQKHVPGSIETNHGSLSKIIGQFSVSERSDLPSRSFPRYIH